MMKQCCPAGRSCRARFPLRTIFKKEYKLAHDIRSLFSPRPRNLLAMTSSPRCALCTDVSPACSFRPLVPAFFLQEGIFSVDPLGSAGAGLELCPDCARVLSSPMLLPEDAAAFAEALALHRRGHPPAATQEAVADQARLWHRALHLGLRALVAELQATAAREVVPAGPAQLDLFSSRTARLAALETSIDKGNLPESSALAAQIAARFNISQAAYLAQTLPPLNAKLDSMAHDPEGLADALENQRSLLDPSEATAGLAESIARHIARRVGEAAEKLGALSVRGRPAGWYWLRAAEPERARAVLEAAVAGGILVGRALPMLAEIERAEGRERNARELYRRAFCEDPLGVDVDSLADEAVRALVDEARELELSPPEIWVPLVGWAMGTFGLSSEPQGQAACRDFHAALLDARRGGGTEARRRMKSLAPLLFEQLRDAGRL